MTLIGGRHSNWVKALSIELAFLLSPTDDIKKKKGGKERLRDQEKPKERAGKREDRKGRMKIEEVC